jgi:hypothetical protein
MITAHFSAELSHLNSALPIVTSLGISAALFFLVVQVNRIVSKEVFEMTIFKNESAFPTTEFLLPGSSHLASQVKALLIQKIHARYTISIPAFIDTNYNESDTRLAISTAISQIRNDLRDNALLLQHNIEYGFARNFIGGCVVALLFSFASLAIGFRDENISLIYSALILMLIYSLPLIISRFLMRRLGRYYAKILYEQFLSLR